MIYSYIPSFMYGFYPSRLGSPLLLLFKPAHIRILGRQCAGKFPPVKSLGSQRLLPNLSSRSIKDWLWKPGYPSLASLTFQQSHHWADIQFNKRRTKHFGLKTGPGSGQTSSSHHPDGATEPKHWHRGGSFGASSGFIPSHDTLSTWTVI